MGPNRLERRQPLLPEGVRHREPNQHEGHLPRRSCQRSSLYLFSFLVITVVASSLHQGNLLAISTIDLSLTSLQIQHYCCSGCWISDPLNFHFGRRGTIFFSAIFCLVSVIGGAFSRNWWELFICRLLLGVGMGSKASTVSVYAAENSPALIRGSLCVTWQMWTAFGIFL